MKNEFTSVQITGITATELFARLTAIENAINTKNNPETPQINLLTRDETAKILGVSTVTLHYWTKKGILTAYKIGNQVRYKENEVLQALQSTKSK